ncbi:MAG: S8 family serine peptidase [Planctomycetes bacterium]|nr:S8 family serine peptidase [Planctomycetota bacterium]
MSRPHRQMLAFAAAVLALCSAGRSAERERCFAGPWPQHSAQARGASSALYPADPIGAAACREVYHVDGTGLCVAVLDTGLRTTHLDFADKVLAQKNFTDDSNADDASDGNGHGTHVAGIVCAGGIHTGVAPGAKIVPLKVLDDSGSGYYDDIEAALQWVVENHEAYNITVVNLSVVSGGCLTAPYNNGVREKIQTLRALRIPVTAAAGNRYHENGGKQGMCAPAVFPETVSVGALYAVDVGPSSFGTSRAYSTAAQRVAAFSQRLSEAQGGESRTDVFAPGAPMTSSGIGDDSDSATAMGTSQAAPLVAGVVLLLQEHWLRHKGQLPTVEEVEAALRGGSTPVNDGDDEDDNVAHTGETFAALDAVKALAASGFEPMAAAKGGIVVASEPSATPDPAQAGVPVDFALAAQTVDGGNVLVRWDFGDGLHADGAHVRHVYAAAGSYTVRVSLRSGGSKSARTLSLAVAESGAAVQPMAVDNLLAKIDFRRDGNDQLSLKTRVTLPQGFEPDGTVVTFSAGTFEAAFVLDAKGRAKVAGLGACKLDARNGCVTLGLKRQRLAAALDEAGLPGGAAANAAATLYVTLGIGETAYGANVQVRYSAKAGKGGVARSK